MTIQHKAFRNCIHLKEINFSRNTEVVTSNVYSKLDSTPVAMHIVVPDDLKQIWTRKEIVENRYKVCSRYDMLIEQLYDFENIEILKAIHYLSEVNLDNISNDAKKIIDILRFKYRISNSDIKTFENCLKLVKYFKGKH